MRLLHTAGAVAIVLLTARGAIAQDCQQRDRQATDQRREEAVRYLRAVHEAQRRSHAARGRFAALVELRGLPSLPVGLVPRLVHDQWSYVASLKDLFDRCGFVLFADEHGTVYEASPYGTTGVAASTTP